MIGSCVEKMGILSNTYSILKESVKIPQSFSSKKIIGIMCCAGLLIWIVRRVNEYLFYARHPLNRFFRDQSLGIQMQETGKIDISLLPIDMPYIIFSNMGNKDLLRIRACVSKKVLKFTSSTRYFIIDSFPARIQGKFNGLAYKQIWELAKQERDLSKQIVVWIALYDGPYIFSDNKKLLQEVSISDTSNFRILFFTRNAHNSPKERLICENQFIKQFDVEETHSSKKT